MKPIFKHCYTTQPQQIVSTLVITSILCLGSSSMLIAQAVAAPDVNSAQEAVKNQSQSTNKLPRSVANAVLQDLSRKENIPLTKLKITDYSQQTWPGGCLGLAQPDEVCTLALIEGWRVTVSDNRQTWVYRTDSTGQNLRRERQNDVADLPKTVADAVLQEASQQSNLPISQLRIVQAERRQWSDGCLGLGGPEVLCAAVVVPGWLVTVTDGQQRLVYRTNESGSVVVLDEAASLGDASTIKPVPIPESELPPPLKSNAIFRVITTGGFAGLTTETNLLQDGRLIRVQVNNDGTTSQTQTNRSQQQVRQFQQLLEKQQIAQFNNLSYPPPSGAADYNTITLSSCAGTTRYTDIDQDLLPSSLQEVIQAWQLLK